MSEVRTEDESLWRLETTSIGAGLVGGLLGGIAMGVLLQLGTDIMAIMGTFLGETSPLRGWIVHLVISLFNGAAFALVLGHPSIRSYTASFDLLEFVLAGVLYVYAFAAVTLGVLPFVLELPWATDVVDPLFGRSGGQGATALIPAVVFAVAHIVYGAILGAIYGTVRLGR